MPIISGYQPAQNSLQQYVPLPFQEMMMAGKAVQDRADATTALEDDATDALLKAKTLDIDKPYVKQMSTKLQGIIDNYNKQNIADPTVYNKVKHDLKQIAQDPILNNAMQTYTNYVEGEKAKQDVMKNQYYTEGIGHSWNQAVKGYKGAVAGDKLDVPEFQTPTDYLGEARKIFSSIPQSSMEHITLDPNTGFVFKEGFSGNASAIDKAALSQLQNYFLSPAGSQLRKDYKYYDDNGSTPINPNTGKAYTNAWDYVKGVETGIGETYKQSHGTTNRDGEINTALQWNRDHPPVEYGSQGTMLYDNPNFEGMSTAIKYIGDDKERTIVTTSTGRKFVVNDSSQTPKIGGNWVTGSSPLVEGNKDINASISTKLKDGETVTNITTGTVSNVYAKIFKDEHPETYDKFRKDYYAQHPEQVNKATQSGIMKAFKDAVMTNQKLTANFDQLKTPVESKTELMAGMTTNRPMFIVNGNKATSISSEELIKRLPKDKEGTAITDAIKLGKLNDQSIFYKNDGTLVGSGEVYSIMADGVPVNVIIGSTSIEDEQNGQLIKTLNSPKSSMEYSQKIPLNKDFEIQGQPKFEDGKWYSEAHLFDKNTGKELYYNRNTQTFDAVPAPGSKPLSSEEAVQFLRVKGLIN